MSWGRQRTRSSALLCGHIVCACIALSTAAARAQPDSGACPQSEGDWLVLKSLDVAQAQLDAEELVKHIQAELALRQVEVCRRFAVRSNTASAQLDIWTQADGRVAIVVHSMQTTAAQSRLLDLRSLPIDARYLAIAVAADELLRAVARQIEPPPESAPPPVLNASESNFELGPAVVADWYAGGQAHVGADVRAGFRAVGPLLLTLRFGIRSGLSTDAPNGTIDARGFIAGAGFELELTPRAGSSGLDLVGRFDALRLSFEPHASSGALEQPRTETAFVAGGGLVGWARLGARSRLSLEAGFGTPIRPLHIQDTGVEITAVSGLMLTAGGSLVVEF